MATTNTSHNRRDTRERILDLAQAAVLAKSFANTSIDELIAGVEISRSGFFYHFKDKNALAIALLERYLSEHNAMIEALFARADELHDDPLHRFLIAIKMFAEKMETLPATHPGCVVAALCYHDQRHFQNVRALNAKGVLEWRAIIRHRLDLIAEKYDAKPDTNLDTLADLATVIIEGAIILCKVLDDNKLLGSQILLYREFVRSAFSQP